MLERLNAIEAGLKVWRCVILILTIVMLAISIIDNNQMSIIVLIICFFALILFQLRTLPITSYQVSLALCSYLYCFSWRTSSSSSASFWKISIRILPMPWNRPSRTFST
jgi:hypothetical protein